MVYVRNKLGFYLRRPRLISKGRQIALCFKARKFVLQHKTLKDKIKRLTVYILLEARKLVFIYFKGKVKRFIFGLS